MSRTGFERSLGVRSDFMMNGQPRVLTRAADFQLDAGETQREAPHARLLPTDLRGLTHNTSDAFARFGNERAVRLLNPGGRTDLPASEPEARDLGAMVSEETRATMTAFAEGASDMPESILRQQWNLVRGAVQRELPNINVTQLIDWVVRHNFHVGSNPQDDAEMRDALTQELERARAFLSGHQFGDLRRNEDGSITTPGGYTIVNDGGRQWRVIEPSGREHRIWGDPHVDENNDGQDDWHFDQDASFILPDGTKIFCDTVKVGEKGDGDITVSDKLMIQFGDSLGTMDVTQAGSSALERGGLAYDEANGDGQRFVLGDDGSWKDGETLGDLYDGGGDFIADVDTSKIGTISAQAQALLDGVSLMNATAYVGRDFSTAATDAQGHLTVGEGPQITSKADLEAYIERLQGMLDGLGPQVITCFQNGRDSLQLREHLRNSQEIARILLATPDERAA